MIRCPAPWGSGARRWATARLILGLALLPSLLLACSNPSHQASGSVTLGISPGSRILDLDPDDLAAQLDSMSELGAEWVRIDLDWSRVESERGQFDWETPDLIIESARRRDLEVLLLVTYTPRWARPEGSSNKHPPVAVEDFETFVGRAVDRYGDDVAAWEIWNEPNVADFWEPAADPEAYASLFGAAAAAIHRAEPAATVVTGGVAPAADGDGELSPLTFLTAVLEAVGPGVADAVGVHPYSFPQRPSQSGRTNAFQQLPAIASVADRIEGEPLDLWLTEFGAPTGTSQSAVSEQDQAAIIGEALRCVRAWVNVGPVFVYNLHDPPGGDPADREDNFGLVGADGRRKSAWDEVRVVLSGAELQPDPCGF